MTNETFDFISNGFGNKELPDSEASSSSEEGDKTGLLVEKARKCWMEKTGRRILQQKTERRKVFPKILPRENETTVCMRYMRFWLKL